MVIYSTLSSLDCTLGEIGVCVCVCIYIYIYVFLFIYIYIYVCVCILCIVYLGLNTEVILDLMFQLIEICFAVRMTVDPTSCISN